MVNSRQKGARGERGWAGWLRDNLKIAARRGQQFCGSPDSPDVVTDLNIHWEVKSVERLNIDDAMEQAVCDAFRLPGVIAQVRPDDPAPPGCFIPAVAHKKNFRPWLVTIRAADIRAFCAEILSKCK